jgi:hypothetical protein
MALYMGTTSTWVFARLKLDDQDEAWKVYDIAASNPGLDTDSQYTDFLCFIEDEMSGEVHAKTLPYKDRRYSLRSTHPASQAILQLYDGGPAKQQIRVQASPSGQVSATYSWPRANEDAIKLQDRIPSPVGHCGNVHGTWDERTLIYETGGTPQRFGPRGPRALVVLSFDPATDFRHGMIDQAGVRVGEAPTVVSGLSPARSPAQWRSIGRVQIFSLPSVARGRGEQSCGSMNSELFRFRCSAECHVCK